MNWFQRGVEQEVELMNKTPKVARNFKRVIVCSPYSAKDKNELQRNLNYASDACRDCIKRGEHPLAPHLYYTQFLDDRDPVERQLGIDFSYQMWDVADAVVFYLDFGLSPGMKDELERAFRTGLHIERRFLITADIGPVQPIEPGKSIEEIIKEYAGTKYKPAEVQENALDQNARADGSEDSDANAVGQGQHLQRT